MIPKVHEMLLQTTRSPAPLKRAALISLLTLSYASVISSCALRSSSSNEDATNSGNPEAIFPTDPAASPSPDWILKKQRSGDQVFELDTLSRSPESVKSFENTDLHAELRPLEVNPKFNATFIALDGVDSLKNTVFVLPKAMAFGPVWTGKVSLTPQPDESVLLSFPLAMIDPRSAAAVLQPKSPFLVAIPDEFQIRHSEDLRSEFERQGVASLNLELAPGCPEQIVLEVDSQEFDVTPPELLGDAFTCPGASDPLSPRIRLPEREAKELASKLSDPKTSVQLKTLFEITLPYVFRKFRLEWNAVALYQTLKRQAMAGGEFAIGSKALPEFLRNFLSSRIAQSGISVPGQWLMNEDNLIEKIMKTFYELSSDPFDNLSHACPTLSFQEPCAYLKPDWEKKTHQKPESLWMEWEEKRSAPTKLQITSFTPFRKGSL